MPAEPNDVPESATPSSTRIHFTTTIDSLSLQTRIQSITKALDQGRVVDVHCDLGQAGDGWEVLETLIEKTLGAQEEKKGKLVLCKSMPHNYRPETKSEHNNLLFAQQIYFLHPSL